MVKHIVMFKLNGSEETRRRISGEFAKALLALPDIIDPLVAMEVGINENPAEDWDVVLTATITDMSEVETYAKHQAHLKAAAIVGPYKAARACVDYEI